MLILPRVQDSRHGASRRDVGQGIAPPLLCTPAPRTRFERQDVRRDTLRPDVPLAGRQGKTTRRRESADCSFSLIWRALLLIPVVTRCMAGVAVETFAPMQTSQYAGSFAAGKTRTQRRILLGMYIAVMFVVFLWLFSKPSCALAVAWAGLTTILACRLARRNLGGMSGDIAGFSITLGELSGLLILAIF